MHNTVISLENISKCYRIYNSPKDRLKELIFRKTYHRTFWALKDINLNLQKGDVLGIVGENGAGKSTLLKIISRTLAPTSGKISIHGKISAILELGMGFHPELTGRENIYLAGTLLGLSKKEIDDFLPEIISFADIGDFIEQPIKTYSSGMYVRLAFSIATAIDPDILIVDEALSVGDQKFQKKCINKIISLCEKNKTILFCTHSMYHVLEFCEKAIWLKDGKINMQGPVREVVKSYQNYCEKKQNNTKKVIQKPGHFIWIENIKLLNNKGPTNKFQINNDLVVEIYWKSIEPVKGHIGVAIQTTTGEVIFGITTKTEKHPPLEFSKMNKKKVVFPKIQLLDGEYQIVAALLDDTGLQVLDLKMSGSFYVQGIRGVYGHCFLEHKWC